MCTHRFMFNTDQEFVDALAKQATETEANLNDIKNDPTSTKGDVSKWVRFAQQDRAIAVQFQIALNEGKSLTDETSNVSDDIYNRVFAAEGDALAQLAYPIVPAPETVPETVGA